MATLHFKALLGHNWKSLRKHSLSYKKSSFSTSSSIHKIYELRTYSIKPDCFKAFLELTHDKFHIRTSFSVLHGYWSAELGGLNQVVHIWEYDNYEHRAKVRAALASNQQWISDYFGKILPMLAGQTNVGLLSMHNGSKPDIIHPEGQGVYELWSMKSHNFVNRGLKRVKNSIEEMQTDRSILCGSFKTTFGPLGQTFFLWRHSSFDEANLTRSIWLSKEDTNLEDVGEFEAKGLIPLKISPMK